MAARIFVRASRRSGNVANLASAAFDDNHFAARIDEYARLRRFAMQVKELGHVVLYVRDLAVSRRFYGEVLGWREVGRYGSAAAVYSSGRTHHELLLIQVDFMMRRLSRAGHASVCTTSDSRSAKATTSCERRSSNCARSASRSWAPPTTASRTVSTSSIRTATRSSSISMSSRNYGGSSR